MSAHRPTFPHVPRARLDPLVRLTDALAIVELAISRPLQHETVAIFVDAQRRGCGVSVVTGTRSADAVLDVAACLAAAAQEIPEVDGVVLVSVRPGEGVAADDIERWSELLLLVADHGLELVDWIVLGRHGPELPRAVLGGDDPWAP